MVPKTLSKSRPTEQRLRRCTWPKVKKVYTDFHSTLPGENIGEGNRLADFHGGYAMLKPFKEVLISTPGSLE